MTVDAPARNELLIELERSIDAPIDIVWDALLDELGPSMGNPEGESLSMRLEAYPGGRWYRDLGAENGHLWGHVQAIKRPALIELCGPLFMSQAVTNNVQYRLEETDGTTTLRLVHSCYGIIPEGLEDGMPDGWSNMLDNIVRKVG